MSNSNEIDKSTGGTYRCPCEGCSRETLDPDAKCTACMHAGCAFGEVRCQ